MKVELARTLDLHSFSLWGFDRPTEDWIMPELMLIASKDAFERWMFDTAIANDRKHGDTLESLLKRIASPTRYVVEIKSELPADFRFFEFGTLVYYDLVGKLSVPGVHYIGRMTLRPWEELMAAT